MPDLAVENEPAANSGSHGYKAKMLHVSARPDPLFPQRCRIRIGLEKKGAVQALCDLGTHIEVFPSGQIGRCDQNPVPHPDDSWDANPDACQLISILPAIHQFEDSVAQPVDNVLASSLYQRFQAEVVKQAAILIDGRYPKVRSAQVHADCESSHRLLFKKAQKRTAGTRQIPKRRDCLRRDSPWRFASEYSRFNQPRQDGLLYQNSASGRYRGTGTPRNTPDNAAYSRRPDVCDW